MDVKALKGIAERETRRADSVARQVRAEYREMPGLKLTPEQAGRLWNLEPRVCEAVLGRLTTEHVLRRTRDGAFVRAD